MFNERQESRLIINPVVIGTELNTNLSAMLEGHSGQTVLMQLCQTKQRDQGFPGSMVVKNPARAGDVGSIPGLERFPSPLKKEMAIRSSILAWKIP